MYQNEQGLFSALEKALRAAQEPLTCVQLFEDFPAVKENANSANRVSDYLGNMWRKGKVTRSVAPRTENNSSRWAYSWKKETKSVATSIAEQIEYHGKAKEFVASFRPDTIFSKPGIEIQDSGDSIIIDLPNFTISIIKK